MSDGKLYIIITDKREETGGGSGGVGGGSGGGGNNEPKNDLLQHQFNSFLINEAKQIANASINNIGNFTGDFQTQRQIQAGISLGTSALNIANAFVVGGVVGGAIAIAGTAINVGLNYASAVQDINKQNYQIDQLRDLSGLNNGSR